MEYRGLPLDLVEDLLEKSPAWLQAQRVTHAQRKQFFGRPLTPLHAGHLGLCAVSGLLDGVFGHGAERHVAHWEAIKVVDRTEEEGDDGETVIREKERFSQRLTLLFTDGRIELLCSRSRGKTAARRLLMENAHLRMGKLKFVRQMRDTITEVSLHLDRLVAEKPSEPRCAVRIHLVSVFGGDQDVGAIASGDRG